MLDVNDDPLRTYLREIHEVRLLTARDERFLASRMEEASALDNVVAALRSETATEPGSLDVLGELVSRIDESRDLLEALSEVMGESGLGAMLTSADVRRRIDGVLEQTLLDALVARLDWDESDVRRELAVVSVETRV